MKENINPQSPVQQTSEQLSSQPVQPVENQTHAQVLSLAKSKLPLILLVIFVFLIILGSGAYYYLGVRSKNTNQQKQISIIPTPTPFITLNPTIDETANWKKYTNNFYQIKYPDITYEVKLNTPSNVSLAVSSVSLNSKVSTGSENSLQNVMPISITVASFDNQRMSVDNPVSLFGLTGNTSYVQNMFLKDKTPQTYSIGNNNGYVIYDIGAGLSGLEREIVVVRGDKIYDIQTDISYGKDKEIYKKLVDQILSTFKFTPASLASGDQNQTTDNPNLKTYTSPLGISFTYSPKQVSNSDWTITVKESGNKICVTYDVNDVNCLKGQYVQVFQKSITDSLKNAIKKQFLTNYSLNDCFILSQNPYSGFSYPASYKTAIISFPKSSDPNALPWANAEKCPPSYTATNGLAYFLEDILHPSKMLFFSIGQYSIESDDNKSWEQTVKVLN